MVTKRTMTVLFPVLFFCHFFFPVLAVANQKATLEEEAVNAHVKKSIQGDSATEPGSHKSSAINPSEIILDHVLDGHSFHFFGHVGLDLPVIVYGSGRGWSVFSSARFEHGHATYEGYALQKEKIVAVDDMGNIDPSIQVIDLSITRNVVQLILATVVFIVLVFYTSSKYKAMLEQNEGHEAPKGFRNAMEVVIVFLRDEAVIPNLGKHAYRFLPFLLSVFFFILVNNLFGMLPGSANVTGNIAFTFVLSVITFVVMMLNSGKSFWMHIIWPPGVPVFAKIILIPVEFIGIFVKPFALMIRLFANMLAGHIIILCFILTIFIIANLSPSAGWGFSPISVGFMVFIYGIEILVAFIQAYIFTTLTSVFIGQVIQDDHH